MGRLGLLYEMDHAADLFNSGYTLFEYLHVLYYFSPYINESQFGRKIKIINVELPLKIHSFFFYNCDYPRQFPQNEGFIYVK